MRASPWLLMTLLATTLGGLASSCLKLSWRENIACDGTTCPGSLRCCDGRCLQKCAPAVDDGGAGGAGAPDVPAGDAATPDVEPTEADAGDAGPSTGGAGGGSGDAGGGDRPMIVVCPAEAGGCFSCMPGCACTCGTTSAICCLKLGFATCSGCP